MKRFVLIFGCFLLAAMINAQVPQGFKYQTVARNNAGEILASQNISFRMTVLQGAFPGTVVYAETHTATTNASGLATLEIGRGTPVTGSFATINWGTTPIFLKTEIDPAGGSAYVEMGTSELLSVPYALFAENTANTDDADADPANELQTLTKDGQTVNLSQNGGSFTDEVNDADADPTNELQNLSSTKYGSLVDLEITNGTGTTIDVSDADADPANELQTLTQNGLEVSLSQNGGTINVADNDNNPTNELQQVNRDGNEVSLSQNGGSFLVDDADANPANELQTLTQNGLEVTLSQDGGTINVADNDNQPANELQQITKAGNVVTLSQNGGSFTDEVNDADADPSNELQNLTNTKNGNLISLEITNGTGTTLDVADADADPINELQTVNQTDYLVSLSQGGGSFITGVKSFTQAEIDALTPYDGLTVYNSTTHCINFYAVNNWFETCGTCTPQPTQANAGPDQIGIGGNTTTLAGNTPEQGTGLWSIISGEGGTLGDPTNPNSSFTGDPTINYVLAWTISTSCQSLSDEVNIRFWICGLPVTDERDGKTYNTVQIGTQCWMAQNLNVGVRVPGTNQQTNTSTIEKYCYNNTEANCDIYGGLYQWNEMMNYSTTAGVKGICPDGWHLPTDAEWCTLTTYLDATVNCLTVGWSGTDAGGKMKETGTLHWISPNTGATNSSGFTSLPGGMRNTDGLFYDLGNGSFSWSSSEYSTADSWYRFLYRTNANVHREKSTKGLGFSVRCLKD